MNKIVVPYSESSLGKKEQVEKMFDHIAPRYDFLNHFLSAGIDKRWRKKMVNMLQKSSPKIILDVATGTADVAIELTKLNPNSITGIDISRAMLDIGQKKIEEKKLNNLIVLQQADSENLPFEENKFDAITVAYGVRNFENLEKGLKEILRVLKPGGTFIVLEFSKPKTFPFKQIFKFYFRYFCPLAGKIFAKNKEAYTYLPDSVDAFPDGKNFLKILNEQGFINTTCKPLTFGISTLYSAQK